MLDLKQLQALTVVIDKQSFDKAAGALCVTQSAISQRIKTLESQIGQALLIRGNPVKATEAGQRLVSYYRKISILEYELAQSLGFSETLSPDPYSGKPPQQRLPLSVGLNADSLSTWFLPAISKLTENEHLLLELKTDDQQRTHELLRNGEVIGCISANKKTLQGCYAEHLGDMVYFPACSPDFRKKYFQTPDRTAFLQAPAVEFNNKDDLQSNYLAEYWQIGSGAYDRHQIPSPEAFLEAVVMGLGWGMVPELQGKPLLDGNRIERVFEEHVINVPLYWHVWNLKSDLLKRITRQLRSSAKIYLRQ